MPDIAATIRDAAKQLAPISDTPRLDAELLMAHALNMERGQMLLRKMADAAPALFGPMLLRRLAHEPVAYITGKAEFWSLPLSITPGVLIPRSDSETLIEAALTECKAQPPASILDLGTGSGALICAALSEWPAAHGTAIDASADALALARDNAARLEQELGARCTFQHVSWRDPHWAEGLGGPFDLILCNPPYVEQDAPLAPQVHSYEPSAALFSGADGLDDYTILIPQIPALLSPLGTAIFELGRGQADAVQALAQDAGLQTAFYKDLAGIKRAISLR